MQQATQFNMQKVHILKNAVLAITKAQSWEINDDIAGLKQCDI